MFIGFSGYIISKPLMGELMSIYIYIIQVIITNGVNHKRFRKNCSSCIFHSGIQKIAHRDLFIILPWIIDTYFCFKKFKNLFGILVRPFSFFTILFFKI